jgi:hypothetical protein
MHLCLHRMPPVEHLPFKNVSVVASWISLYSTAAVSTVAPLALEREREERDLCVLHDVTRTSS